MSTQAICWKNGAIVPASEASMSVFDHGFLYGDGVFEGIRFYHARPFRLLEHLRRLQDSAQAIALDMPYTEGELIGAVHQCIAAFQQESGYIRLIVTRGAGSLGINPENCDSPTTIILADQLNMISEDKRREGVKLIIASTRKLPADGLDPRIKSLNYLNHILARIEANHARADEALLLNASGHVAEGTADNLFIVRDNILITPPCTDGALAGITRAAIIDIAREAGIQVFEQSIAPYDVYTADASFLTGTGAELIPVVSVDGRRMPECPGKVFELLNNQFHALINSECMPRVRSHQ